MLKDQSGSKGGSLAEALGSYLQGNQCYTEFSHNYMACITHMFGVHDFVFRCK